MKCTSCGQGYLTPAYLEGLLPCHTCGACKGNLVMLGDYLRWREQNKEMQFERVKDADVGVEETSKAMLCPKTTKYKISKNTDHRLDLSPTINAVWMDAGEWELIKENGLAGKLNNIFTDHWQMEIRSQESADVLAELYRRKFGDQYQTIREFRETLNQLDSKSEALAYLMSDDPYSP